MFEGKIVVMCMANCFLVVTSCLRFLILLFRMGFFWFYIIFNLSFTEIRDRAKVNINVYRVLDTSTWFCLPFCLTINIFKLDNYNNKKSYILFVKIFSTHLHTKNAARSHEVTYIFVWKYHISLVDNVLFISCCC